MRCALYVRVSTTDQNPEMQHVELNAYASARNFNVTHTYEDRASGTNTNRPAFKEMLSSARARQIDLILVWKLDRFARSMRDLVVHLQELDDIGVKFVSLRDQFDLTTAAGRLMMNVVGSFAQFEASLISERVKSGIENARRNGKRLGRPIRIDEFKVLEMRKRGMSLSQIGKQVGCTKAGVSKILSRMSHTKPETNADIID